MDTMTISTDKATRVETILQKCVCIIVQCGQLGNTRRVELAGVEMEKDGERLDKEKRQLRATKPLFAHRDLRPCMLAVDSVKNRLRALSVNGGVRLFGPGTYMINRKSISEAEQILTEGATFVAARVEELVQRLDVVIEKRREELGKFFRRADYPTADEVREAYHVDWNYVSFGSPENLEEVDAAVARNAEDRWNEKLSRAYDDVVVGLREAAALVMRELAEKLKPNSLGYAKALQPEALAGLQGLLQRLPVLNVTGDVALEDALAHVGGLAEGLDVETLRKAPAVRNLLMQAAEEAADRLDALVSGSRGMSLGGGLV